MLTFNIDTEFKTRVAKGTINANEYVKVSKCGDWETYCTVKDSNGNEEVYKAEELIGFGFLKANHIVFDIIHDYCNSQDELGNKNVLVGLKHITKNVRGGLKRYRFWKDCLYCSNIDRGVGYVYKYEELSDEQIIDTLLNEILYDREPMLQSTSCVGTSEKGIDKDPNYHDGNYTLNNNVEYTMTYCRDTVIIREGNDGGWYSGTKNVGRTIYKGEVDWERIKKARIKRHARHLLNKGYQLFEEYPEILNILTESVKDDDGFKLNKEFTEK